MFGVSRAMATDWRRLSRRCFGCPSAPSWTGRSPPTLENEWRPRLGLLAACSQRGGGSHLCHGSLGAHHCVVCQLAVRHSRSPRHYRFHARSYAAPLLCRSRAARAALERRRSGPGAVSHLLGRRSGAARAPLAQSELQGAPPRSATNPPAFAKPMGGSTDPRGRRQKCTSSYKELQKLCFSGGGGGIQKKNPRMGPARAAGSKEAFRRPSARPQRGPISKARRPPVRTYVYHGGCTHVARAETWISFGGYVV